MAQKSSSVQPSPNLARITITTTDGFEKAIEQYIDDNRPDPISVKQLRGWSLKWQDEEIERDMLSFDPSHALHGTLQIGGDYMIVSLKVCCAWSDAKVASSKYGKLQFSCHASARFLGNDELQSLSNDDAKQEKIQNKIRSKMIQRLSKDAYIAKLLATNKDKENGALLAQAKIKVEENDLEERVDVSAEVTEAIKRAIWSSAETPLDIIELILHFPCLPTAAHKTLSATTELANRAKLRLLEDAMVDACEQEGEDQILEDLDISSKQVDNSTDTKESLHKGKQHRKKMRS